MFGNEDSWRAEMEQAAAGLKDFAAQLAQYHKHLAAQGFSRSEALAIVVGFQAAMLAKSSSRGET